MASASNSQQLQSSEYSGNVYLGDYGWTEGVLTPALMSKDHPIPGHRLAAMISDVRILTWDLAENNICIIFLQ